ncbi:hypothetical protein CLU79DRAFT_744703 [Phycomyces nitens]|nr:hypothetical protein CLU79DRAFT_744703 [Phycomyces nitens]
MTQHLRPRIFPLLHLALPVMVTLKFQESETGQLKIIHHEEHWTVEGLLQTIPLIAFWHDRVLRIAMGKILTVTGQAMNTAIDASHKMIQRSIELERAREQMIRDMERERGLRTIENSNVYQYTLL